MNNFDKNELFNTIEAMLFASGDPVSVSSLAEALEIDKDELSVIMEEFTSEYNYKKSGLHVIRINNSYQLCTRTEYVEPIRKLLLPTKYPDLSRPALEVLSIIAYNQPVIKSVIEQVRGVDCSGIINKLLSRDLIEERGRHNSPGRPILYGTTQEFLRAFGLSSIDDLPGADALSEMINASEQLTIPMD